MTGRALSLGLLVAVSCSGGAGSGRGPDAGGTNDDGDAAGFAAQDGGTSDTRMPPAAGTTITTVTIEDTSDGSGARTNVPVTFGQVFAPGDVPAGMTVAGRLTSGDVIALQLDETATHGDGSLRFAVITAILPQRPAVGGTVALALSAAAPTPAGAPVDSAGLLAGGFDAQVTIDLGGAHYTASARALLAAGTSHTWLHGPLSTEWILAAPLADSAGHPHPHLAARFNVRAYADAPSVRIGIVVENDWAYEPAPQNFTYDVSIALNGSATYNRAGLVHYHAARWRKVFWSGGDPQLYVRHDGDYLVVTGAVPSYDTHLHVPESVLSQMDADWKGTKTEPMGIGIAYSSMPDTGGRPDIAPLPGWIAQYLRSMDPRAQRVTLGTADGAGSWSIHYRDRRTDLPVSIEDYPYAALPGDRGNALNPHTQMNEAFPDCSGDCSSPYTPEVAHEPSFAFVPYLVTGDQFYLEELQFWANWNFLSMSPGWPRGETTTGVAEGLLYSYQVRGQAWSLRTLAHAAYVTPDAHPMKRYFADRLGYNLAWYNQTYTNKADANPLGNIDARGNPFVIPPWMDDFFTWSVGYVAAMGFADALPLLRWKARFPVGRMIASGYCWIFASPYELVIGDQTTVRYFTSFADAYTPTLVNGHYDAALGTACASAKMAQALSSSARTFRTGEMVGYADELDGYPSQLQPALAVAVDSGIDGATQAWQLFTARPVQPDYSTSPQWAIVPRAK